MLISQLLLIITVNGCSYQRKLNAAIFTDAKAILERELDGYNGDKMPHHLKDASFINYYGGFYIEQMERARQQPQFEVYKELTDLDVLYKLGMPDDQDLYQALKNDGYTGYAESYVKFATEVAKIEPDKQLLLELMAVDLVAGTTLDEMIAGSDGQLELATLSGTGPFNSLNKKIFWNFEKIFFFSNKLTKRLTLSG